MNGPQDTVTVDDLGMTSFGTYLTIAPGETRTFTLTYALPQSVTDAIDGGSYELRVLKQLGASDNGLTLHLEFPSKSTSPHRPRALHTITTMPTTFRQHSIQTKCSM